MNTNINEASATFTGYFTTVKIGSWKTHRKMFVNTCCIVLQIACCDCTTCDNRMKTVEAHLREKMIGHFWNDEWVVITHESIRKWSTEIGSGKQTVFTRAPLEYLSEIIGESCVEIR
jgi:hypothetical protein